MAKKVTGAVKKVAVKKVVVVKKSKIGTEMPVVSQDIKVTPVKAAVVKQPKKAASTVAAVKKAVQSGMRDDKAYIVIDHPVNNERILPYHYAVRIGASGDGQIQIAFNNGEWLPCRHADGYWWYDWYEFKSGPTKIVARMCAEDGAEIKRSSVCKCVVE